MDADENEEPWADGRHYPLLHLQYPKQPISPKIPRQLQSRSRLKRALTSTLAERTRCTTALILLRPPRQVVGPPVAGEVLKTAALKRSNERRLRWASLGRALHSSFFISLFFLEKLQISGVFIYPFKNLCTVNNLQVLSFLIFLLMSTCLVDRVLLICSFYLSFYLFLYHTNY
jgi:hypothetical protein